LPRSNSKRRRDISKPTPTPVEVEQIDPNPFRDLDAAPLNEESVQARIECYRTHGHLPGTMRGRMHENRVQIAYGHRTLEAARRLGLPTVDVVIDDDLTDDQMIAQMPTEHGEHAKRDFPTCLVAWLAAACAKFCAEETPTDIARRFGWTYDDPGHSKPRMNIIAIACTKCAEAIQAGKAEVKDFAGMSAHRARTHALILMKRKGTNGLFSFMPAKQRGISQRVVTEAKPGLSSDKRPLLLRGKPENIGELQASIDGLKMMIDRLLHGDEFDEVGRHLSDLAKSMRWLTDEEEQAQVEGVRESLGDLVGRILEWDGRLAPPAQGDASPEPEQDVED
jgi:hypothetical protein